MNELQKTGTFWGLALVVTVLAMIVAWPASEDASTDPTKGINLPLFAEFKDPLAPSSLKIVTFNETLGELRNFEVRQDSETGLWKIPSKGGYPADAVEQMRDAANSLVGLKILDVPTENPEDHVGMGVVEPKLEDLNPGDEGVGRLVTFKDASQKVLASLIIGGKVKDQEGQVYVRKPGQDPVYVVALDDKPLTTKFEDWIEEDLLQLSSIDLEKLELVDQSVTVGLQGGSLTRNYVVDFAKDSGNWQLASLREYDKANQLAPPKKVEIEEGKELNTQKINDLTNALDDLKFVDVRRKPDGISANLKADKELISDQEVANQLARTGFYPVPLGPNRELEIVAANGELTATTKDGVQYILRFGNISGISSDDDSSKADDAANEDDAASQDEAGGVNRYLMVSTVVDESMFPVPELKPIPQTLEELDAIENPPPPPELNDPQQAMKDDQPEDSKAEDSETETNKSENKASPEEPSSDDNKPADKEATDSDKAEGDKADSDKADEADSETEDSPKSEEPADDQPSESESSDNEQSGETEASGEGESTTVGEGQEPTADQADSDSDNKEPGAGDQATNETDQSTADDSKSEPKNNTADKEAAAGGDAAEANQDSKSDKEEMPEVKADEEPELTEEEKLEKLAAVQEKITKENERKLDERKEQLEKARLQSKALNERFADWYYVIPEATYSKLRIGRDELFKDPAADAATPNPAGLPPGFPGGGLPGGFPPGVGN